MKLLFGDDIKDSLRDISPERIAVAYVGWNWRQYVNSAALKEIILAPVFGSCPKAIRALVDKYSWDNVYFLDNLHAKIYLGAKLAAIGSFNLSDNGMAGDRLFEAGYLVSDPEALRELASLYDELKKAAIQAYPKSCDKLKQLQRLEEQTDSAHSASLLPRPAKPASLAHFIPLNDSDFYCCAYREPMAEDAYDVDRVAPRAAEPIEPEQFNHQLHVANSMTFHESDEIRSKRWILYWKCNRDGSFDARTMPKWMYTHDVVEHGAKDDDGYTKLAVQWSGHNCEPPLEPFELDDTFKNALKAVLESGDFPEFRAPDYAPWSIQQTFPKFRDFILALKREYAKLSAG